jgi:hypothetical protein
MLAAIHRVASRFLCRAWMCLKTRTVEQWLALGTWVLAAGTIGLWLDARHTSERQLRAYVFATPYRAFNIDDRGGVAQVYTTIGSKGTTFASKAERSIGASILSGPVPERFEDLGSLKRYEGVLVLAPGAEGLSFRIFMFFRQMNFEKS